MAEMAAFSPDAIALTGDLTNFALPSEFAAAGRFIERLGPPGRVLVIPGNHDALVRVPEAEGLAHWSPWMRGDGDVPGFPYLRRRGGVALIGLSSAIVTAPGFAAGALGGAQLERLGTILARTRAEGLFRLVMIHHPPVGENNRRGLRDRAALLALLAREGAEMLIHGHSHRPALLPLPGRDGRLIPSIGIPPALHGPARRHPSRWHRYAISPTEGGWEVETLVRGISPSQPGFSTLGRWRMKIEAAPMPGGFRPPAA